MEINWKNKYLKYKLKYNELKNDIGKKNIQNNILSGGNYNYLTPDSEEIFSQIYEDNIENGNWDKKTILLDCIGSTQMQTETIKFIKFIIEKKKINLTKSQLEIGLVFSVFCGYYLIVEELIKLGANPNVNYGDWTLVDTAIDFYFYKTAKILMGHGGLSKKYYSQEQLNSLISFSNDPENYIGQSNGNTVKLDNQIYIQFKQKILNGEKFNFENLSRNILGTKLKKMIKDNN
jgi:hypothetical protein